MKIYKTVKHLQAHLAHLRAKGEKIAFAPTMGALHQGHVSLIQIGREMSAKTVCSLFVNPTQFNNMQDLLKYPRMLEKDTALLRSYKCDVLFAPSIEEIYPPELDTRVQIDLQGLDKVMEGVFRPGHFDGMLQVVKRLLDIVQPDFLIMGQKDFQQVSLVQLMIRSLKLPVQLVLAPTLRESDGLAMSSRNMRLSPQMRKKSVVIYKALSRIKDEFGKYHLEILKNHAWKMMEDEGLRPEYVEIVDGNNLQSIVDSQKSEYIVVLAAAWANDIRLIDNLILKSL